MTQFCRNLVENGKTRGASSCSEKQHSRKRCKTINTFTLDTSDSIKTGCLDANCREGIKTLLLHSNWDCVWLRHKKEKGGGGLRRQDFQLSFLTAGSSLGAEAGGGTDSNQFAVGGPCWLPAAGFRVRTPLCPVGVTRAGEQLCLCPSRHLTVWL